MAPSSPILPKTTQDLDESKYSRHGLMDAQGQAIKPDQQTSNNAAAIAAVEGDLTEAFDAGLPFMQENEQIKETDEEKPLPVEAEVRSMMQRYPVLVFSKSYCP
ncbi:unnamed protein product [Umbelopsis sp. WA50703]